MTATYDLLSIVQTDTTLKKVSNHKGGEWHGPCPFCGGVDRFRVQPNHESGVWMCRQCEAHGDAVAYLVAIGRMGKADAYKARHGDVVHIGPARSRRRQLSPPSQTCNAPSAEWQGVAFEFLARCQNVLGGADGTRAMAYLHKRGLNDDTITAAGLGFNPDKTYAQADYGIVIPWFVGSDLWRVNVRRPVGTPKYRPLAGGGNALYNADQLRPGGAAIMVEGEFDTRLIEQFAGDLIVPVGVGANTSARLVQWIIRLALCSVVLVAFDSDDAGMAAREYWVNVLSNARAITCPEHDPTDLWKARGGHGLRSWVVESLA